MVMAEDLELGPSRVVGDEDDGEHNSGQQRARDRYDPPGSSGGKLVVLNAAPTFGEKGLL